MTDPINQAQMGPECPNCQFFYGRHHRGMLVCAVHPYGPEANPCPDFDGQRQPMPIFPHTEAAIAELEEMRQERLTKKIQISQVLGEPVEVIEEAIAASNFTLELAYHMVTSGELTIVNGRFTPVSLAAQAREVNRAAQAIAEVFLRQIEEVMTRFFDE